MAAVAHSEFMPDPFLPHDLVHLHVSVQQAVVITAINVIKIGRASCRERVLAMV